MADRGRDRRQRPTRYWEIQARVAIDWVRNAADEARARDVPADERAAVAASHAHITAHLDEAESYLDRRATFRTWRRGTRVEGAWAHIHAAKVALVRLLDTGPLLAYSPRVLSLVELYLTPTDPERVAVTWWFDQLAGPPRRVAVTGTLSRPGGPGRPGRLRRRVAFAGSVGPDSSDPARRRDVAERKAALAAALQACYERIAAHYQRLRRFQFTLIGSAAAVLAIVGALLALGAFEPDAVPLCFPDPRAASASADADPEAEADGQPVASDAAVCPSRDVATVVLFGLLGASVTSISLVVRKAPPSSVPMASIRVSQAVLKAATGMMTAVLGLLFLRAGVIPGFTQVDTRTQILVYAVVFGAAQQLATRFIDSRSNELLAAVTSTDEEAVPSA